MAKRGIDIFVSKIPWTVARSEVGKYFGQFGVVTKCRLPFDLNTGFHKGHCWVGFKTEEGRDNALQQNIHVLEGTTVHIEKQTSTSKSKIKQ